MKQEDGRLSVKTPLEILIELGDPRGKAIDERELELYQAFRMDFNTLDPPKDLCFAFGVAFVLTKRTNTCALTHQQKKDLSCWGEVLGEIGVEPLAAQRLAELALNSPMGRVEASRLLAHLLKYNEVKNPSRYLPHFKNLQDSPNIFQNCIQNNSRYLMRGIDDCFRYLEDWRFYEALVMDPGRGHHTLMEKRNHKDLTEKKPPLNPTKHTRPSWMGPPALVWFLLGAG